VGPSTLLSRRQRLSRREAFAGSCRCLFTSLAGPRRDGCRRVTVSGPRLAGRQRAVAASSTERQRRVIDLGCDEGVSSPLRPAVAWGAYVAAGCNRI
jgi:hypothetical protein